MKRSYSDEAIKFRHIPIRQHKRAVDNGHVLCYSGAEVELMNNEILVVSLIKAADNKELNSEIEYHMEVEREYPYSSADALNDVYDFAEYNNLRKLLKVCRGILIKAGFYREQSVKNETGRDTRFTYNGKKYECVKHWSGWING